MRVSAATLVMLLAWPAQAQDSVPEAPGTVGGRAQLKVIARGLDKPVGLTFAPGDPVRDRLFVVEKVGRVRALVGGRLEERPLLDVSDRLSHGTEQGLLGLAFHPKYGENGRLFINYTDKKGDTHVVEFRVRKEAPGRVDPASEREWLKVDQPYNNHNGGDLVFGPDGRLYIGLGDGGSHGDPHGNGQNPAVRLAKMLRLDVDAATPAPEIHLIGLRNPWRYAFDRATGELYIADVGQDKYEEVDVLPADPQKRQGLNLGWNRMEGLHCFGKPTCDQRGLTLPVVEYSHRTGCSITGGLVYRGKALPVLDGLYFYSDYCTAILRGFRWKNGHVEDHWDFKKAFDPDYHLSQVATFGEDADGEIYVVSLEGTIYKLVPR
jgi:glucose/arabinose dehydrogenase